MKRVVQFFKDSIGELKKVIWPSQDEVIASTKVVLVSVVLFAVVLGVLDFVLLQFIDLVF